MGEDTPATKEGTETPDSIPNFPAPKVIDRIETGKPATEEQLENVKSEMNAFERSTLKWTRTTAGIGLVTAFFICLQWCTMKRQLDEMHSGGVDTHNLATAASAQAAASKASAEAAKSAAETAQNSLRKSIESFRIDDRAWVEIGIIDKKIFPPDATFGANFKYGVYLKNVGKTVAHDVHISLQQVGDGGGLMSSKRGIKMSQDQLFRISGTAKRNIIPDKPGPQTLAPGQQSVIPVYSGGAEPKRMADGSFWYNYVLGRIEYVDAFGALHWTHICFFISNSNGDLGHCEYGNDSDTNPEPSPN